MGGSSPRSAERDASAWLSERAQRGIWWTLVAFAVLDWTHPMLALTQEWLCVLLVLWIVPRHRPAPVVSSFTRIATWISACVLFGWLVLRTEMAVRESVSTWLILRSSTESERLSYFWHATIAALVTSLVTVIPLRRIVGEPAARAISILACLPYSMRLAGHFLSILLKPLAVPVALYALLIPALAMVAVTSLPRRFRLDRERVPCYRSFAAVANRMLKGRLNPFGAVVLYAGALVMTLWFTTSWVARGIPLPVPAPDSLIYTAAFPWVLAVLVLSSIALWRRLGHGTHRNVIAENLTSLIRGLVALTLVPAVLAGFFLGLPYSAEVISETVKESAGPGWSIVSSDTGSVIRISGEIQSGLTDAVVEVLERTPG